MARARLPGSLLFFFLVLRAAAATAGQELLVDVSLNEVSKGVFFAVSSEDGALAFADEDLRSMGFRLLPGEPRLLGGVAHHWLHDLPGVRFTFDARTVSASITAPPELLEKKVIDFLASAGEGVEYPVSRSAFFNYQLLYHGREGLAFSGLDATGEVGVRAGSVLLLTDGTYRRDEDGDDSFVRLMTHASWEDRVAQTRLTLGDFTIAPGDLWGAQSLGGISFSRLTDMNPYLIRHPTFGLTGQAPLPSELLVYLDGVQIRREELPPGEFEIRNLDSYGGDRNVEVVLRDAFGRETRLERPFYFTDAVLRAGTHEYSYGLGWARTDYGEASNHYGEAVLAAFHRYGLNDTWTVGFAAEAESGIAAAGPTLSLVAGSHGTISIAASAGRFDSGGEFAAQAAHEYQGRHLTTRLRFRRTTGGYRALLEDEDEDTDRTSAEFDAGISVGSARWGSLTLAYASGWAGPGPDRNWIGAEYHLGFLGKFSFVASVGHERDEDGHSTNFYTGLSYFPRAHLTSSFHYAHRDGSDQMSLTLARDREDSMGLQWQAAAQRQGDTLSASPSAAYYGRYGIVGADLEILADEETGDEMRLDLLAAGSVFAAGGKIGLGRPVEDSFALVKVGKEEGLSGVRVYAGGNEQGRTDEDGTILLPEISSYLYNQIAIEPEDIPLGYSIDRIERVISPAARSGSVVSFEAARYQAVTGRLRVRENGALAPMEYLEIGVEAGGRHWSVPSGGDGEFFLENVGSGFVTLSFRDRGRDRSCVIDVPESEELIVEIGEVSCEFFP